MESEDLQLIQIARYLIARRFKEGHHHIAAALRTRSGQIFTGVRGSVRPGSVRRQNYRLR